MTTMKCLASCLMGLIFLALSGCASAPVTAAPLPPAHYRVLGRATGHACGVLGFLGPALYVVPIGLNERMGKAYGLALQSVPGATGLINVELQDDWFWWVLASSRCATVSGDAIQEVRK